MLKSDDLYYDPETGKFYREAGCQSSSGYRQIWFQDRQQMEHRVAWFLHYGEWPKGYVDHINGDKSDNRISNLREATASENLCNRGRQRNNTSGHKGVSWHRQNRKWKATISVSGRNRYLGSFDTKEEAAQAYNRAALHFHGKFAMLDL